MDFFFQSTWVTCCNLISVIKEKEEEEHFADNSEWDYLHRPYRDPTAFWRKGDLEKRRSEQIHSKSSFSLESWFFFWRPMFWLQHKRNVFILRAILEVPLTLWLDSFISGRDTAEATANLGQQMAACDERYVGLDLPQERFPFQISGQ